MNAPREHEIARIPSHCDVFAAQERMRSIATRDAALIATGFVATLRRSEHSANGYPRKGFLWGTNEPEEAHSLFERGKPLGLRPASLGLVCVDVGREGGRDVMLQALGTDPITHYTTSQDWKSHNYYRPIRDSNDVFEVWE